MEYEKTFTCAHCGEEFRIELVFECDDGDLCPECANVNDEIDAMELCL